MSAIGREVKQTQVRGRKYSGKSKLMKGNYVKSRGNVAGVDRPQPPGADHGHFLTFSTFKESLKKKRKEKYQ